MFTRRSFLAGLATACAPRAVPVLRSEPRALSEGFHRGMNLAHLHRMGWGYGSERARAQLVRLKALGVRAIALNPFAYTPSLRTPEIRWDGDPTLTDDALRAQVSDARALGMAVMMKPHLWSDAFWFGAGNGDIELDAEGWKRWFTQYTSFAGHYARLAEETGCASFCVGLEYTSATRANPGAWAAVAGACREVYRGPLLYAANWYQEFEVFTDWDAFDLVGVNAYFPVANGDAPTVESMEAAWAPHLDAIERVARGKPVIFPEAGYQAVAGAAERPWESRRGPRDADLQARAYEALLRACTARAWFRGVYWWKWFTDLPGEDDPFVPAGGPAEDVLRAWFG